MLAVCWGESEGLPETALLLTPAFIPEIATQSSLTLRSGLGIRQPSRQCHRADVQGKCPPLLVSGWPSQGLVGGQVPVCARGVRMSAWVGLCQKQGLWVLDRPAGADWALSGSMFQWPCLGLKSQVGLDTCPSLAAFTASEGDSPETAGTARCRAGCELRRCRRSAEAANLHFRDDDMVVAKAH